MASIYQPLNFDKPEIRILKLAAAADKGLGIFCSLETVSLDDEVNYEALSYVWGTEPPSHQIHINGQAFSVRPNLHMALQRLRSTSTPRLLWIDAICIDQDNITERNHQVSRMRDIYARALRVLVWLGPSDIEIDEAIDAFSYPGIAGRLRRESLTQSPLHLPNSPNFGMEKRYEIRYDEGVARSDLADLLPTDIDFLGRQVISFTSRGLKGILRKPWWSRVWVVQEYIMARSPPLACIGESWVPWDVIFRILMFVTTRRIVDNDTAFEDMSASTLLNIGYICQDWDVGSRPTIKENVSFEQYLAQTAERAATDARDKVFALIGLVPEVRERFNIDYALPTKLVFQKAMIEVFRSSRDMSILQFASRNKVATDLPSWCVDFSTRNWFDAEKQTGLYFENLYGFINHDPMRGSLTIRGKIFARIANLQVFMEENVAGASKYRSLLPSYATAHIFAQKFSSFRDIAHEALSARMPTDQAEELLADGALWDTWFEAADFTAVMNKLKIEFRDVMDREWARTDFPARWSHLEQAMQQLLSPSGWTESSTLDRSDSEDGDVTNFMKCTFSEMSHELPCSLLTTDNGYVAKISQALKATDVLCAIYNCSKVAVIRPNPDRLTYTLVGFAYVHGFNYREWTVWNGKYDSQEFVLV